MIAGLPVSFSAASTLTGVSVSMHSCWHSNGQPRHHSTDTHRWAPRTAAASANRGVGNRPSRVTQHFRSTRGDSSTSATQAASMSAPCRKRGSTSTRAAAAKSGTRSAPRGAPHSVASHCANTTSVCHHASVRSARHPQRNASAHRTFELDATARSIKSVLTTRENKSA